MLHRDIKPANIILGKHGETLVVDWGLAKARGRADALRLGRAAAGAQLGQRVNRNDARQRAGNAGVHEPGASSRRPGALGPAVGRLQPGGDTLLPADREAAVRGQRSRGDSGRAAGRVPAAPRSLVPSIDRALEAVCLKAMAPDPADRYATPKALGEEVERWMADEAVAAYRESWTRTLTRWLTRHRTGVTAIGAAMLVALAGLGAVLGVQARSNGQLTAKNAELDVAFRREADARKEAQANFNMALKAVEDYLTSVSENTLLKQQDSVDIRGLRKELLNTALQYYKNFVNQRNQRSQSPPTTGKRLFPRG